MQTNPNLTQSICMSHLDDTNWKVNRSTFEILTAVNHEQGVRLTQTPIANARKGVLKGITIYKMHFPSKCKFYSGANLTFDEAGLER